MNDRIVIENQRRCCLALVREFFTDSDCVGCRKIEETSKFEAIKSVFGEFLIFNRRRYAIEKQQGIFLQLIVKSGVLLDKRIEADQALFICLRDYYR